MGYSYGYGYGHTWKSMKRRGAVALPPGGAALLVGETDGLGIDFTYATDAQRVAVKTAGTTVSQGLDTFFTNTGTSPKMVFDASGAAVWAPHNMISQSENISLTPWVITSATAASTIKFVPNTSSTYHRIDPALVTSVAGQIWTYSTIMSSAGYYKVALVDSTNVNVGVVVDLSNGTFMQLNSQTTATITPLGGGQYYITITGPSVGVNIRYNIYILANSWTVGTGVNQAWVGDGVQGVNFHRTQINRGDVATAYLPTTTVVRCGIAIDYDPVTHVCKGTLMEGSSTNLLLNNTVPLVTQNVTVAASPYVLSFMGTGTITLSGVSTAGPLVGTGVSNRVSLNFTPTAGTLTVTVSGTVSNAQLELFSMTSIIATYGATATRNADVTSFLLSSIPAIGSDYSVYVRASPNPSLLGGRYFFNLDDGTAADIVGFYTATGSTQLRVVDNSVLQANPLAAVPAAGVVQSVAGRVKLNDFAASGVGAAAVVDTAGTLPGPLTGVHFGTAGGVAAMTAATAMNIEKMAIVMPGWNNATLATKSAT